MYPSSTSEVTCPLHITSSERCDEISSQKLKLLDRVDMFVVSDRWIWITRLGQHENGYTDQKGWDDLHVKIAY
jgi:hypothetical protein